MDITNYLQLLFIIGMTAIIVGEAVRRELNSFLAYFTGRQSNGRFAAR